MSTSSLAQKVAHINTNALVELMPEKAEAEQELIKMHIELEALMTELLEKYNAVYNDIAQNGNTWSDVILRVKNDELKRLEALIEEAKMMAQEELAKKEFELVQPILVKAKAAIQEVADDEGYEYVIDSSNGALLVFPDNKDILELVAVKLGISINN